MADSEASSPGTNEHALSRRMGQFGLRCWHWPVLLVLGVDACQQYLPSIDLEEGGGSFRENRLHSGATISNV